MLRNILSFLGLGCALAQFAAAAEAPASFKVGEFTFDRAAKWNWVESNSPMRKAQLKVASADGKETCDAVFYYFGPGNGGGTAANVERWLGQFQEGRDKLESKVEETKISDRRVTFVQAQGTYLNGMPGGPKTPQPGTMLRGAILESGEGSVFIKMTGPIAQMKSLEGDFRTLVQSALKK
ncbi:MAG: hypothetical protein HYR88_02365 [Verrucomicrobia bacterium]|nr:hypothetical protein [Verrucomicrobiota bacterium]MBI3869084.1 hypothetical protein [Verrucomicrobiota bacterium]